MSCQIKRNQLGEVISIVGDSPSSKKLINDIVNIPGIYSLDQVASIYTDVKASEINLDEFSSINFKSSGKSYDSYRDMLLENEGASFEAFINTDSNSVKIAEGTLSVSKNSTESRINNLLMKGYLTGESRVINGKVVFEPQGESLEEKAHSIVEARSIVGKHRVSTTGGNELIFNDYKGKSEEIADRALEIMEENSKSKVSTKKLDLDNIESTFLNFLNSLGISITTLDNYKKRFQDNNQVEDFPKALADISKGIIAIEQGQEAEFYEELSHIAIEYYNDQESIEEALVEISETKEFEEFYSTYKNIYSQTLSGLELEQKIRREILGKYLSTKLKNKKSDLNRIDGFLTNLWNKFKQAIIGNVRPYHSSTIEKLTNDLNKAIVQNNIGLFTNKSNRGVFYSVNQKSSLHNEIDSLVTNFNAIFNNAKGTLRKISFARARQIDGQADNIRILRTSEQVLAAVESVNQQTEELLKTGTNPALLKGHIDRVLGSKVVTNNVLNKFNKKDSTPNEIEKFEKLSKKISESFEQAESVQQEVSKVLKKLGEDSYIQLSKEKGISEEKAKSVLNDITTDSSLIFKWLGLISNSVNPIVAQIPKVISDMTNVAKRNSQKTLNPFLKEAEEKGWLGLQKNIYALDEDGKKTGEVWSPWDFSKQRKDREEAYINTLIKLSGKEKDIVEKAYKNNTIKSTLELNSEQMLEYSNEVSKINRDTRLNIKDSSYYNELEDKYKRLGISNATREFKGQQSAERYSILSKIQKDGIEDRSLLSSSDKLRLEQLHVFNKIQQRPYDSEGNLKEGLLVKKIKDLTAAERASFPFQKLINETTNVNMEVVFKDPSYTHSLAEDSIITLDLNNLTYDFIQENIGKSKGEVLEEFKKALKEQEVIGPINALDWIRDNGGFGLSEEYLNTLSGTIGYEDSVVNYIDSLNDMSLKQDLRLKLQAYKELNSEKSNLIKPFRTADKTASVNLDLIPKETKNRLKELDSELQLLRNSIKLPEEFSIEKQIETETFLNTTLSEKFKNDSLGLINYLLDNMTEDNRSLVLQFKRELKNYQKARQEGRDTYMKKSFLEFINNNPLITTNIQPDQAIEELTKFYAISKAPTYMKTLNPVGTKSMISAIETGSLSLTEIIENKDSLLKDYPVLEYFDINPSYSWREESSFSSTLNPNYKEDSDFDTPKDLNNEFFNRYFNNPEQAKQNWLELKQDDISLLTPTKNTNEYEFLVRFIELNKKGHELNGVSEEVSKYQVPQFPRSKFERTMDTITKENKFGTLKDSITDFFVSREDELLEGEVIEGLVDDTNQNVIPKYGVRRLKDQNDLSENSLFLIASYYDKAELYKSRENASQELLGRLELLKNLQYKSILAGKGNNKTIKKTGDSNSYKMTKRKIDEQLFGVKESYSVKVPIMGKEWDVTATMNSLHGFVTRKNLAYNIIADVTSLTSGVINTFIETQTEEFWSKKSAKKGRGILTKMMAQYTSETGKLYKKSDFNKIGEYFGVFDIEDRLDNSKYNRFLRMVLPSKSGFGISEAANIPVIGKVMINSLVDTKYIDGQFLSSKQYYNKRRKESKNKLTKKEIELEFHSNENKSLYDFLDLTEDTLTYNKEFEDIFGSDSQKEFEKVSNKVSTLISEVNQHVDGMISQANNIEAKANFLTNFFMTHKSWFTIAMAKRWKGRGFDFMTGRETQGSYNNLFKEIIPTVYSNIRELGTVEGFKKAWEEVSNDDISLTSMKRIKMDTMLLAALLALGELVQGTDDPDDSWLEDFYQLVYLRTTAEVNSNNFLGIRHNLYEILESPIVALGTIKDADPLTTIGDLIQYDDKHAGKLKKRFINNIPVLKRGYDFIDLKDDKGTYIKYNDEHLYNLVN